MSGPKHAPTYPDWVTKMVGDHYDRIGEGVEDKPHLSIADMILDGYQRGQRDTAELVELLARMTHTVRSLYQNTPPAGDDAEVLGLITAAEAVLARVKERR